MNQMGGQVKPHRTRSDLEELLRSPEVKRQVNRSLRLTHLTAPLRRIPVFGPVIQTFWFCILDEGIKQTLTPRWGAMTFSFLGDSDRPSVWHTWQEIRQNEKYAGVYEPHRAPVNKAEADALLNRTHPFDCTEHPRKDGMLTRIRR